MPVTGRKPKPDGQKRNRVKPTYEWTEVPDVPFAGKVPALPKQPRLPTPGSGSAPAPARPLGQAGLALWGRGWRSAGSVDAEALLVLCEQMDERVGLRVRVLRDADWRDRAALRALDAQVASGLSALGLDAAVSARPAEWPAETKRWWRSVSRMPHCVLWSDADWQFALDTALVAAAFHAGDLRLATELRQRERIMGTTTDARRDLRIRYVDPAGDDAEDAGSVASVTAMADYRRMASGT